MPDTPEFDQIARRIVDEPFTVEQPRTPAAAAKQIAEQLRQVWNARGAADLAKLEGAFEQHQPSMKTVDRLLRGLDR